MKKNKGVNEKSIEAMRHSAAHLLAAAVQELYPKTKFGIGPAVECGFYYDMELIDEKGRSIKLQEDDLLKIENKMRELRGGGFEFVCGEMKMNNAVKLFKKLGQTYKIELLQDLKKKGTTSLKDDETENVLGNGKSSVSVYKTGNFIDLCRGPHVASTKDIGAFRLHKIAGAYWRGDETNQMLTRIYGLAFTTEAELNEHLRMLEEIEKRDHRKLGKALDLFVFSDLVGSGLPLYTARGAVILKEIIKFSSELQNKIGYQEVHTPNMNKADLFKISGHYEKYKDNMFKVVSNYTGEEYYLKPMNCPQHTQIYTSKMRSYKDLPIRMADFANLYRDEKPGELAGLARLRAFRQDDGHCFCREDQIKEEFAAVLGAIREAMDVYKMNYTIRLSLLDPKNPKKYLGELAVWKKSQKLLEEILIENQLEYQKAEGEAAIYGPKMDLISKDSLGREWQISTIQLDFIMPERFGLKYTDVSGKEKTPVMIHRALVGSPERFLGILIEHYAGAFPLWLSPVQAQIIPVGRDYFESAGELKNKLESAGIRAIVDDAGETVGYKIRKAEREKVPYMLVIGDRERDLKKLSIRERGKRETFEMALDKFIEKILGEIKGRA
jgi:threonyl-tRNA synthetase